MPVTHIDVVLLLVICHYKRPVANCQIFCLSSFWCLQAACVLTGLTSQSHLLSCQRISVFGLVARLDDDTPANMALQLHINVSLNRPPDCTSSRPPGRLQNKWLDQLRNDSTRPIGELWSRAVDRGHGGATTRRPSPATRLWWWWWCCSLWCVSSGRSVALTMLLLSAERWMSLAVGDWQMMALSTYFRCVFVFSIVIVTFGMCLRITCPMQALGRNTPLVQFFLHFFLIISSLTYLLLWE